MLHFGTLIPSMARPCLSVLVETDGRERGRGPRFDGPWKGARSKYLLEREPDSRIRGFR